jgi:hypothetical protein
MTTRFPHPLLALSLVACLGVCGDATIAGIKPEPCPVRYVIGISPFLEKDVKDPVFRQIVGFLLEDAPLRSSLWLYDAFHLRTITRVEIPDVSAFRSAKTRANQFRDPIRKLRTFLAAEHPRPDPATLSLDQAVRLPQFLDFVGDNLTGPDHAVVVMVLGSPLYLDDKEPGFSMVDGYYPSDGHLLASREASVFGLKARSHALRDVSVHLGWFGDPWVHEAHQDKIDRFWTLYLMQQGAQLASFCGDLPTLFNALRDHAPTSNPRDRRHQLDPTQSRIEMLRVTREIGVSDWITRDTLPNVQLQPPTATVGVMKLGIRWKGDIDLDLYARPTREGETLYFEHVRSPEGYYFKDHRSSPDREFEFIEFESPVDVWNVVASVNFYEGRAPGGPKGEVRIEFDGKIFADQFQLTASEGNRGRSGRDQDPFWVSLDIPAILKLRDVAQPIAGAGNRPR